LKEISSILSKLVGLSLILVGFLGLREIKEEREEKKQRELKNKEKKKKDIASSNFAIFITGVVQGIQV
jgi:hypothetical protein